MKTQARQSTFKSLQSFFTDVNNAGVVLLVIGAVLRLRQYLTSRSLWMDEAMLALNIVNRDFTGLFKPLDYDQGTPLGFLLVEKLFNLLLGRNELVLRLFPFIVGVVALWLFHQLLQQTTRKAGFLLALALFAFNPRLIYYSSEVKQYIVDAAVAIGLLLIGGRLFRVEPTRKEFAWFTLAGMVGLWFSHPAVFVLAGIGLSLVWFFFQQRNLPALRLAFGMGAIWLLNLALFYWLLLNDLRQNSFIRDYWQEAFAPMPPWSDPGWYLESIEKNIDLQFDIPQAPLLVFGMMLAGWVVAWRQKREYALMIAGILLVTLIASAWRLYPVSDRMILFLVPVGLLLLGWTVEAVYQKLRDRPVLKFGLTLAFSVYLLYGPFTTSLGNFLQPKYYEHIRPALAYLQGKAREGDVLYVTYGATPAFRFYAPGYGLDTMRVEFGEREGYENPQVILQQLDALKGQRRVWVLMSHVYEQADFNEQEFILEHLDQTGRQVREVRRSDTSVYLYFYNLAKP